MSKKRSKTVSDHIVCPDCGSRLSTLDLGSTICFECGWSWTPAIHGPKVAEAAGLRGR